MIFISGLSGALIYPNLEWLLAFAESNNDEQFLPSESKHKANA
jgi:hypothetical protein